MSDSTKNFDAAVDVSSNENDRIPFCFKHGAYIIVIFIWEFFRGPKKAKTPKKIDSQFKFIAERLITTLPDNPDKLTVTTTKQLLEQHRTIENTQARRRLERWARRSIVTYLICVFMLLILNGLTRVIWPDIFNETNPLFSDSVLYVILSTTTVNILGLGYIVLKGHFPQREKEKN